MKKFMIAITMMVGFAIMPNVYAEECDLSSSISGAQDGGTIQLTGSCSVSSPITINKNITIDLNGHTITSTNGAQYVFDVQANVTIKNTSSTAASIEGIQRGIKVSKGNLTVENVTVKSPDRTIQIEPISGEKAKAVINSGAVIESTSATKPRTIMLWGNNTKNSAELIVNGGTIKAPYSSKNSAAINLGSDNAAGNTVTINGGTIEGYNGVRLYGNGTEGMTVLTMNKGTVEAANAGIIQSTSTGTENTTISIYGGNITAKPRGSNNFTGDSVAIYHGQKCKLTIGNADGSGPVLQGQTGVSIKEGNVLIQGGNIIATGEGRTVVTERTDGTEDSGAAVSITTNSESNSNIELTVTGGKLSSSNGYAIYEGIAVDEHGTPTTSNSKVSLVSISGGNFEGKTGSIQVTGYQGKGFITGGQFIGNVDPSYIHEGLILSADGKIVKTSNETNPDTADINLGLLLSLIAISTLGFGYAYKKRFN